MNDPEMPIWDELLSAGARLQSLVPGAVLVGGTAAAIVARHRRSQDADHILNDLRGRFDDVLGDLESVAGWKTARIRRPVLILGSLDGIETGIRQLIRSEPLETQKVPSQGPGSPLVEIPTPTEILRIKAALILKRNATRDYVDVAALVHHLGVESASDGLARLDALYPQENGQSAIQQLVVQLNEPRPYDLDQTDLSQYKGLDPKWHDWRSVHGQLKMLANEVMEALIGKATRSTSHPRSPINKEPTSDTDRARIVSLTDDLTEIGPGKTKGRIRFNWSFLSGADTERRLAFLDQHPDAFKARLEEVWRERDPRGYAAWMSRGQMPEAESPRRSGETRRRRNRDPFS